MFDIIARNAHDTQLFAVPQKKQKRGKEECQHAFASSASVAISQTGKKQATKTQSFSSERSPPPGLLFISQYLDHIFDLDKLLIVLERLWVQQRAAWLDLDAGYDLLDGEFDLFEIDSCLFCHYVS